MEELSTPLAAAILLIAIVASLGLWTHLFTNWRHGRRVLPRQSRRLVPWGGAEAIAVFVLHLVILALVSPAVASLASKAEAPVTAPDETTHFIIQYLLDHPNPWAIVWTVVAVVVITPIAEEFVYRLVILGWLESLELPLRRRFRLLHRVPGVLALLVSAVLFALLHVRGAAPRIDQERLFLLLSGTAVANVLAVVLGTCLLRATSGATWADLGWDHRRLGADVRLGLTGYLAALAPVFAIQILAMKLLPKDVAADPAAIFVFALALGWLFLRTHRLAPSIVCHMALNGQTVLIVLLSVWTS